MARIYYTAIAMWQWLWHRRRDERCYAIFLSSSHKLELVEEYDGAIHVFCRPKYVRNYLTFTLQCAQITL